MKYLISNKIHIEDFCHFIQYHDGKYFSDAHGVRDIDAIACYKEDAEKYRKYGKKIITVTPLNELF